MKTVTTKTGEKMGTWILIPIESLRADDMRRSARREVAAKHEVLAARCTNACASVLDVAFFADAKRAAVCTHADGMSCWMDAESFPDALAQFFSGNVDPDDY